MKVWDNPDHIDRYTIVIEKAIFAMSSQPNQGVNQFVGELDGKEPPLTKAWGEQVDVSELPDAVKEAADQRKEDRTLKTLKREAKQKCFTKGHKLGPWDDVSPTRSFNCCQRCSRWVSVASKPDPIVSGTATKIECR